MYRSRFCTNNEDVLSRHELNIRKGLRRQFLDLIGNRAQIVSTPRQLNVTSDPDDNIFVECADAARADYLLTGKPTPFPEVLEADQSDHFARIHGHHRATPDPVSGRFSNLDPTLQRAIAFA